MTVNWEIKAGDSVAVVITVTRVEGGLVYFKSDDGTEAYRRITDVVRSRATITVNPQWDGAVCRGSWVLGTACGHCSRCAAELPKAMEYFRDAVLEGRLRLVIQMIPAPSGMGDYANSVKVHLFEALRAQLYDEKGNLR